MARVVAVYMRFPWALCWAVTRSERWDFPNKRSNRARGRHRSAARAASSLDREDQTGCGAVRQQLARRIDQPALRCCDARPDIDHLALGAHRSGLVGHGADVVDLDLEGGEAEAGLERGVDAAAHYRIEQGRGDTAVHAAERIVVIEHRLVIEGDAAVLDQAHRKAESLGDRRRREAAVHDA